MANDESARPEKVPGPSELISPWGLPLLNTVLLVTSSFTVTFAHHGINEAIEKTCELVNSYYFAWGDILVRSSV